MIRFGIVETRTLRLDTFQQFAQLGNMPLAVAEIIKMAAYGFSR